MNAKMFSMMLAAGMAVSVTAADAVAPAAKAAAPAKAQAADLWGFLPPVVAKVNGKDITKKEFVDFAESQLKGPDGKMPAAVTPEMLKQFAPMQVKGYVDQKLVLEAAEKAGYKSSEENVRKTLKEQFAAMPKEQQDMVKMQMQASGKSLDAYIYETAKNVQVQQGMAIGKYIENATKAQSTVTEKEAEEFYKKNSAMFKQPADAPGSMRASHILYAFSKQDGVTADEDKAVLAKATAALKKIQAAPAKFEEVASAESACPSKMRGGSLGAFNKGDMVPEFEKAVEGLKAGEIAAAPVKTKFGYHIIRRDAAAKEQTMPFSEVKERLMEGLKAEKAQKAISDMLEKLEKDNRVEFIVKPAN